MFGETTIFYVMIWNHPVETTIKKTGCLEFQVYILDQPPGWIYHDSSHGNPLDIQVLDRASMTHLGHVFNDGPGPTGGLCAFGGSSDWGSGVVRHFMHGLGGGYIS